MSTQAFKLIFDCDKAKQLNYIQENKETISEVQELDHHILVNLLFTTCVLLIFNLIGATMRKFIGAKLKTRVCNDYIPYYISCTSFDIIILT